MSRKDMWQPEQPSSHTVASLTLLTPILPHHRQVREEAGPLRHFADRLPLLGERPGRADLDALAAPRARLGGAPGLVQVGDDLGADAAPVDVPGVRPLHLSADADAPLAEDAAVVVVDE